MYRIISLLLATVSAAIMLMVPTSASAETCFPGTNLCQGGRVYHLTDEGYDPAIIIFCNYGAPWENRRYVVEGSSSQEDCGDDTDQIYIREGEELWCHDSQYGGAWKAFDATGRHKIDDLWDERCELRTD
jgi:hypothetical protein